MNYLIYRDIVKHHISLDKSWLSFIRTSTTVTCACAFQGGNDYEIYSDPRTIGHEVSSPEETQQLCQKLFFSWLQNWAHGEITISHFKSEGWRWMQLYWEEGPMRVFVFWGGSFWQKLSWPVNLLLTVTCYSWLWAELCSLFSLGCFCPFSQAFIMILIS